MAVSLLRALLAAFAGAVLAVSALEEVPSFGTLITCDSDERCLWADRQGAPVPAEDVMRELMRSEGLDPDHDSEPRSLLQEHVQYIEGKDAVADWRGDPLLRGPAVLICSRMCVCLCDGQMYTSKRSKQAYASRTT